MGANNVLSERFERKFCAKVWSESFDRKLLFRSLVLGIGGRRAGRPLLGRAVSWAGDGWGRRGWAGRGEEVRRGASLPAYMRTPNGENSRTGSSAGVAEPCQLSF